MPVCFMIMPYSKKASQDADRPEIGFNALWDMATFRPSRPSAMSRSASIRTPAARPKTWMRARALERALAPHLGSCSRQT